MAFRSSLLLLTLEFIFGAVPIVVGADDPSVADQRMEIMKSRSQMIRFRSLDERELPERLQSVPLFRYEDLTRGYIDGTVWRLGKQGRPYAIITTELHPNFFSRGPKIIYEFLSLTEQPFTASATDFREWRPEGSAVEFETIEAPAPADVKARRNLQFKQLAKRFEGHQSGSRRTEDCSTSTAETYSGV